jgi:hypothetical protein
LTQKGKKGLTISVTKLFKNTIKSRLEGDPAFGAALFQEAVTAF